MKDVISYKHIYRYYKKGSFFYDKELNKFQVVNKLQNGMMKLIVYSNADGKNHTTYNITKASRILLYLGIEFLKIKENVHWDKKLFYSEDYTNKLKKQNQKQILIDYENTLKEGIKKGIITKEEYETLKKK